MILCIPSGRLLVGDPLYFNSEAVQMIAAGNLSSDDIHEMRVPNTAIVEPTEEDGRVASISLVFAQESAGLPEVIAELGVDTGQMVFADAAHFASEWIDEDYQDVRIYRHQDGRTLQYMKDFPNYESEIPSEGGKTMNQLNASGEWEKVKVDRGELKVSYNGLCHCHEEGVGMIGERVLVTDSGYGDGAYKLTKTMTPDGRIARITMTFIGDNDDDDDDTDWDQEDDDDDMDWNEEDES